MNLQATIDINFKGFFQWWGRELAFLVPAKIRHFFSDKPANLIFSVAEEGGKICYLADADSKQPVFQSRIDMADPACYQNLLIQHPDMDKAECILCLNEAQAIFKVLYLPEAAIENLQQVVGFELDRYTPFKTDQVYYTQVALGKTGQGQIQVLLVLTPQIILDDLIFQLHASGVQPRRIEVDSLNEKFPELQGRYNLLPERYQPTTSRLVKFVHWILSGILFLLFLTVIIFPVWQQQQQVEQLKAEIKALDKDTRFVDSQQLEIDALRDETQKLLDIKNQTPELGAVLNELTHLLKDDTWLTNLQYSEKHMQIQGQSPTASDLIGLLETSAFFSKVSFVSPLTQDKTTGMERFQISMEVNPQIPEVKQAESEAVPASAEEQDQNAANGVAP